VEIPPLDAAACTIAEDITPIRLHERDKAIEEIWKT